jgi:hypothetical protein
MSLPSNGITADVIRDVMPPYHLSADLLKGTFRALPAPPADASTSWRHERIARLIGEITTLKPADASQARIAAQILIVREAMDDTFNKAYAPELTVEQLCRLRRTAAALTSSVGMLERSLVRHQQTPVPFFGTVVKDEVDIAAVDAVWCSVIPASAGAGAVRQPAAAEPATAGSCLRPLVPEACPGELDPGACPRALDPGVDPVGPRLAGEATPNVLLTSPAEAAPTPPIPDDEPEPVPDMPGDVPRDMGGDMAGDMAVGVAGVVAGDTAGVRVGTGPAPETGGRNAGSPTGSVVMRLDHGPGWTLDVVRPRAGVGAMPEAGRREAVATVPEAGGLEELAMVSRAVVR